LICAIVVILKYVATACGGATSGQTHNNRITSKLSLKSIIWSGPHERINEWPSDDIKLSKQPETGSLEALMAGGGTDKVLAMSPTPDEPVKDDWYWVEKARHGDATAFEALYRANIDRVYALCLRMTANVAEAEDCAQEAFIQAWQQLSKFRGDSAFGTWLHRVAVNSVLGRMRNARRERDRVDAVIDISPFVESIGDDADFQDLEKAMDSLPTGARHVFVLNAVYGYSHDETGEMLGIAAGTSKAQLHRARRLLAEQLQTQSGAA
jgi:RNA polymerase sigma-70 factor (ECF subfamily)